MVGLSFHTYPCLSSLLQLEHAAHEVGHGQVTVEAAALDRALRVNDSIARNPQFAYETPRILGATAESAFMIAMFRSNQTPHTTLPLTLDEARHFFDLHRLPEGFHRRQAPFDFPQIEALTYTIIDLVGIKPGHNEGVNNYVVNPEDPVTVRRSRWSNMLPYRAHIS